MSTRKNDIRSALREHLLTFADLPTVNWEGRQFEPTQQSGQLSLYIRETMLPADESITANKELTGLGIYQLDVIFPQGYPISDAENLADDLKEHFRPAQVIDFVTLEGAFVGQNNETDPPWIILPITINYRVHSQNLQPA